MANYFIDRASVIKLPEKPRRRGLESFWVGELQLFRWLSGKESSCHCKRRDVGDLGLIPGSEIAPGEGNGNPVQVSCLGSSMNRVAWWTTVHGVAKSQS